MMTLTDILIRDCNVDEKYYDELECLVCSLEIDIPYKNLTKESVELKLKSFCLNRSNGQFDSDGKFDNLITIFHNSLSKAKI